MFTIQKKDCWFNPYFVNGKQITEIRFFNSEGVLGSVRWFGSNNKNPLIQIPTELKNKRKIDFNVDYSYTISDKEPFNKGQVILYVPVSELECTKAFTYKEDNLLGGYINTYRVFSIALFSNSIDNPELVKRFFEVKELINSTKTKEQKELENKAQDLKDKTGIEVSTDKFEALEKYFS